MWETAFKYPIPIIATLITVLPIAVFLYRLTYYGRAMRFYFIYLVAKLVIEIIMWYMASEGMYNLFLANTLTIVGYSLFARMFYEVYESQSKKNCVSVSSIVFLLVVCFDIYRDGMQETFKYSGMAQCIFVMWFCLMFFYELIQNPKVPDLVKFPFFWLCSALLLYFAPCVFLSPMQFYLDRYPVDESLYIFTFIPYLLETAYLTVVSVGIMLQD